MGARRGFGDETVLEWPCPLCERVASLRHNLVTHLKGSLPRGHGLDPESAEALVSAGRPRLTTTSSDVVLSSAHAQPSRVTEGHRRSLRLLADTASIATTLEMYCHEMDRDVGVYLRPTGAGLTVLSLDTERCLSMVSVGERSGGRLNRCPPDRASVSRAVAAYESKLATLQRSSDEERFAVDQIAAALANHLRLPGTPWLFLHQEWRLASRQDSRKIDLLGVDVAARRLVVIECKASQRHTRGHAGADAAGQADAYADELYTGRDELYPFFADLLRAIVALYAPELAASLVGFSFDPTRRPTTAVWWPGHTPPWPAWNALELRVERENQRVARYRAHQSQYRETVLQVGPGPRPLSPDLLVGNTLDPMEVTRDPRLNFISEKAFQYACERSAEVQVEGGTLEQERLFHNLLSSMTMCFNFIGSLRGEPGLLDIVRSAFDPEAAVILDAVCEVKPTTDLKDRTAFDALILYRTGADEPRFVAIETKYTETFSKHVFDGPYYRQVTGDSHWFLEGVADRLHRLDTNQLWRGVMLASLAEEKLASRGSYAVVTTADDESAYAAVQVVRAALTEPERLRFVTLEQIVDIAKAASDYGVTTWASAFASRYLPGGHGGPPNHD